MTPSPANPNLADLAAGQPEAYAALYGRFGTPLLRVARTLLRSAAEAEDAVQDVFVDLARYRRRFALVTDLDAYVFAVLRHSVQRRLRRQLARDQHMEKLAQIQSAQEKPVGADGELDLEAAINALPPQQREVVALKTDGGLTFRQIAEVLRISPNTAASRYRYALEKLREALR
jgi:RNA polymerase sigma-70 factor, ECF subfamily